jgi:hypothetical protein
MMDKVVPAHQPCSPEPVFLNVYGGPGIDSKEWIPPANVAWAGICSRVKGWKIDSRNRLGNKFGIEVPMSMSTSKSIFHTESILGIDAQVSINVYKYGLWRAGTITLFFRGS